MAIIVSYIIGLLFILFPKVLGKLVAELLDFLYEFRVFTPEEKKHRPIFPVMIGILILVLTYVIDNR